MPDQRDALRNIRTFPQLIKFLRDELDWPIESEDFEELTFDYTPEELGIDTASAAKIQEIKRLRPLSAGQPWGIFFVKFEPKRLPVVVLRRVLSRVVLKKRASANSAERTAWQADDLLFVSNYGEGEERQISFAHFSQDEDKADLPTLKVLGWDNRDTPLHLDDVAETLHQRLAWPEDDKNAKRWREQWRAAFTLRHLEVITTSKDLAVRLAELARAIRDRIQTVLAIETEKGPLTRLMKAFQEALIHDLSADDFADMYAQTIAYGLLSARVAHPAHDTADAVATHIPVTNPFLKELMETFLHLGGRKRKERGGGGIDFDELGVSEVVELLDAANMEAVVRDFGDRNRHEDPVIHFYELFLKVYDAKKRMQRGVFYTPQPVVSYIVRSVHELLQTEFGLEDGLADTTTWNEMLTGHKDLRPPAGISLSGPFVQILDPATGTATFLVEAIDVIYLTLTAKWKHQRLTEAQQRAAWNEYVPKHLLPRLHGYELLMAPYAIAHMKIGLKLYETGYRFGSEERARIYLTNALEPATDEKEQREFEQWVPALAHEAQAVNAVKRHQRFTVVIGNPPYSGHSANQGEWIRSLVQDYYFVGGEPLGEQNPKWLQDDYVKFIRLGEREIARSNYGLLGFITNHGYLENPTFRGLRHHLLQSFTNVRIIDLHGNTKKKERSPDGSVDENVFDIQQGVAISLCSKVQLDQGKLARHLELYGPRSAKYSALAQSSVSTSKWTPIEPQKPFYLFTPQEGRLRDEYAGYWKITEAMPVHSLGVVTARDDLCINWDKKGTWDVVRQFAGMKPEEARRAFELGADARDWQVKLAQQDLKQSGPSYENLVPILYRPFDLRWTYYTGNSRGFLCMPRGEVMGHMLRSRNLGISTTRNIEVGAFGHVFCSRAIIGHHCVSLKEVNYLFPLYLSPTAESLSLHSGHEPNFDVAFLKALAASLGSPRKGAYGLPQGLAPEEILHYVYAVFNSPSYRRHYAEFLRIDFPRLPLTGNLDLFRALARLGGELVALHLLESHRLDRPLTIYTGSTNPMVEKISYASDTVWLDKAQTSGFRGVPEAVWNFHIGGYQVCEKWLKDRKGRTLSKDDIAHYHKIVVSLSETIRIMAEIDKVIERHGGWPGAFVSGGGSDGGAAQ